MEFEANNNIQLKIGIADVLSLIPEFTGRKDEVDFVYFREGCRDAMRILGPKNEKILLMFLKTRLKDDAYTRFALRLTTYDSVFHFLHELKKIYAPKSDIAAFWTKKMMEIRLRKQPLQICGAQIQELIQCAVCGSKYIEPKPNTMPNKANRPREEPARRPANQSPSEPARNASPKAGPDIRPSARPISFQAIMQMINATLDLENSSKDYKEPSYEGYKDPEVTLRSERGRRENNRPLSIKGADYPQIEYPKSPTTDHRSKKNYNLDNDRSLKNS